MISAFGCRMSYPTSHGHKKGETVLFLTVWTRQGSCGGCGGGFYFLHFFVVSTAFQLAPCNCFSSSSGTSSGLLRSVGDGSFLSDSSFTWSTTTIAHLSSHLGAGRYILYDCRWLKCDCSWNLFSHCRLLLYRISLYLSYLSCSSSQYVIDLSCCICPVMGCCQCCSGLNFIFLYLSSDWGSVFFVVEVTNASNIAIRSCIIFSLLFCRCVLRLGLVQLKRGTYQTFISSSPYGAFLSKRIMLSYGLNPHSLARFRPEKFWFFRLTNERIP